MKFFLLVIICISVLGGCDFLENKREVKIFTKIITNRKKTLSVADTNTTLELDTIAATDENDSIAQEKIIEAADTSNVSISYYVIAGSYSDAKNAEKLVSMLKEKGYSPRVLFSKQGKLMVSACSFSNKSEASRAADEIKKEMNIDCWLYSK